MNRIISAQNRLREATGLPAVLDAAYDAFETIRSVLREHDDPADAMFVPFVMSATSAANVPAVRGDGGVAELVAAFVAGTTREELGARYGVSLSSVKRLLRNTGTRRRVGPPADGPR
jgi:hypothetical protein